MGVQSGVGVVISYQGQGQFEVLGRYIECLVVVFGFIGICVVGFLFMGFLDLKEMFVKGCSIFVGMKILGLLREIISWLFFSFQI